MRSAWRDKSRKYITDIDEEPLNVLNVELFKKWGRKDDNFSKFFGEGKNPYSKEATEQFYGHADHCRKTFGVYSKVMIQNIS